MKEILYKLSQGINSFDCTVYGQKRKCKILELDLKCFDQGFGSAFVRLDEPVKKTIRKESETNFSFDDGTPMMEDVEIESYEEWISIN